MGLRRIRLSLASLMILIVALAIGLSYLRRPYPDRTVLTNYGRLTPTTPWDLVITWSDGKIQKLEGKGDALQQIAADYIPKRRTYYGPILEIRWTSGGRSYYLDPVGK